MMRISIIFFLFLLFHTSVSAQGVRKFREHEIINAGNGLKIEILKCRGEGENEECDVIYYTDKRQQGRRLWENASKLRQQEQEGRGSTKITKPEVKLQKVNSTNPPKDTPIVSSLEEKKLPDRNQNEPLIITPQQNKNIEKEDANNVNHVSIYSLEQCFELAIKQNINLKRAQNNIAVNSIDNKTAKYNLLPAVSYNLGHYFSFGKNIDPVTNTFVNDNFSGGYTALGLQLKLFSGFSRLNTIKQTAYATESSIADKKKMELELLANVTLTYARLLLNKEKLQTERRNMQTTAKQLEVINEKIKVGRLTRYEAYAFNARLNTETANLISIQNDSSSAAQDLKNLLNINYKQQVDIAGIDTFMLSKVYAGTIYSPDLIDTILLNHPAIIKAHSDEQVAQMGLKIAQGNLYPSVSIGGNIATNYNVDQTNSSGQKIPLTTQLNDNIGKNVNVSLHIPIFSQMQNANLIKKEKVNISNAKLNTKEVENLIVTNTLQLINDFNAARQKYSATLMAKEQSSLSYTMYEEKYKLGQINSIELLAARDLYNSSISNYLMAKLELFFRYQLLLLLTNKQK